ncbi:hypothetical protein BJV77DRAFT_97332 [Russula vinacea]|nr:hypothetical protein BJV77DRAFT_97332 [Russula vinacea]
MDRARAAGWTADEHKVVMVSCMMHLRRAAGRVEKGSAACSVHLLYTCTGCSTRLYDFKSNLTQSHPCPHIPRIFPPTIILMVLLVPPARFLHPSQAPLRQAHRCFPPSFRPVDTYDLGLPHGRAG